MCVFVYMYTSTYVCIFIRIYIYLYMCMYTHLPGGWYVHIKYVYICIYTCIHMCVSMCIHIHA